MSIHHTGNNHRMIIRLLYLVWVVSFLVSCQSSSLPDHNISSVSPNQNQSPDYPKAEISFEVQLPSPLNDGENLYLEILDEVSGLALNAARVQMIPQDQNRFAVKLPIVVGSVMKYRYLRDKESVGIEYTSLNQQVRYRLYAVQGPGIVRDTISGWNSAPASGTLGRIIGQVAYANSNVPVVNGLVVAGGVHAITASDGSFVIEGLPSGIHNVVVYSMDGAFQTFQQGAVVAPDSTTPAFIQVQPANHVNITFLVHPPRNGLKGVPIRLAGNILMLGNTFADLKGGISVLASRAPMMDLLPDGRYTLTLNLPVGGDLRYKYTLGDGYWNAEQTSQGGLRLRQLIVPGRDTTIEDSIDSWEANNNGPISVTVVAPADTPVSDSVSIQLNPYGWTEAIPMWPAGNNRWFYVLYVPATTLDGVTYRYCRNDQCGTADAVETMGMDTAGIAFSPSSAGVTIEDNISAWAWMKAETVPVVVPAIDIKARDTNFRAGVALFPGYHPNWQPHLGYAFKNMRDFGSNAVILTATWHLSHQTPPVIELIPGEDPFWSDLTQMANQAQRSSLDVTIHPVLQYNEDPSDWWSSAIRDDGWWQTWFDRYHRFILHHADLAAQTGANALIIGDESILPALPGGLLADGSPSGVPGNASGQWAKLITDVRSRYTGKLLWFIPLAGEMPSLPSFAKSVDQLYVQISPPFSQSDQASMPELEEALAALLDEKVLPLQEETGQPIILGLLYPSVSGALDGCVDSPDGCIPSGLLQQPAYAYPGSELSFQEQVNAYSALLSALNQRSWISGFYAAGYYPPVSLKDMSTSVRSKQASDVLWYWYPRLLGRVTPE